MTLFPRKSGVWLAIFLFLIAAIFPSQTASADTAPKPTMDFQFEYEIPFHPFIVSGTLEECSQPDCSDARALPEQGPQNFSCTAGRCHSMAYDYSRYHRLRIQFDDGKTRMSNVFTKNYFYASYRVAVLEDDLSVWEEQGSNIPPVSDPWFTFLVIGVLLVVGIIFVIAALTVAAVRAGAFKKNGVMSAVAWGVSIPILLCDLMTPPGLPIFLLILGIEISIVAVYANRRHRSLSRLLAVVWMMNLLPLPILGILMSGQIVSTPISGYLAAVVGIPFFSLIDACIMAVVMRKEMRFWEALLLSVFLNAVGIGLEFLTFFLVYGMDFIRGG